MNAYDLGVVLLVGGGGDLLLGFPCLSGATCGGRLVVVVVV